MQGVTIFIFNLLILKKKIMAKYKLIDNVAKSQSFRFDGRKYTTKDVTQLNLKALHKKECPFVIEENSPKPSKKKSNVKEEKTGSDDQ